MSSLVAVDVPGLLSCWGGEIRSSRLKSQVPTLKLRKALSVEKDLDLCLCLRCSAFWRPWFQSSLSGASHRGKVWLRKLLISRGSGLLSVSGLMSQLMSPFKDIPRSLISISESRSSGVWYCRLVPVVALWCKCLGTGDTGGVTMVVVPDLRAPSRMFWSM